MNSHNQQMNIKVKAHYSDHWTAYDEDTYDGPESALGHGRTRAEAIAHLMEQLGARENNEK